MSVMERRLQLLLDQDRYDRLARGAKDSGRSVSALIREAIDLRFPPGDEDRSAALERFLALASDSEPGMSWEEIKHGLEAELIEGYPQ